MVTNTMSKLVSILIPLYNAEQWFWETMESALSQTWPNKEIIIVDDGSTDNSLKIARQYESKSVKVITQENQGAAAARNKAYEYAQGDYIQWLDADDLLAPDKIEKQMAVAEEDGPQVLLTSSWAIFYYRYKKAKFRPDNLWQDLDPADWLITKFNENVFMNPAVWLVSRELTDLAGPWDVRTAPDDDGEYIARVVVASKKVRFVQEARCYYRKSNPKSLSKDPSDKALQGILLSMRMSTGYLLSLEDSERTRAACLRVLQVGAGTFSRGRGDILKKADELAIELGGRLLPPVVDWKYAFAKKVLGQNLAKRTKMTSARVKQTIAWNWDKLLYNLSGKRT